MIALLSLVATARLLDIVDFGAVAGSNSEAAINANIQALNKAFSTAQSGDTVLVAPAAAGPYTMRGNVVANNLTNVSIRFEGDVVLDDTFDKWPMLNGRRPWLHINGSSNLTISGGGLIDGQGLRWWDASITDSVHGIEGNRPNIMEINASTDLLIENLRLHNSPRYHIRLDQCRRVEIRYINIEVDRVAQRRIKARAHALRLVQAGLNASYALDLTQHIYLDGLTVGEDWRDWLLDQLVKLQVKVLPWVLEPEDLNTP